MNFIVIPDEAPKGQVSLPAPTVFLWNRQAGNLVFIIEDKIEISLPLKRDRNDND